MSEREDYDDAPGRRRMPLWIIIGLIAVAGILVVMPILALILFFVAIGFSNM